jgi:hypothetical protein
MANTIALAERFLPILDGIYKKASLTSRLDALDERVRFVGANKIEVFKTAMNGFGDYSRANGFPKGSVTSGWEDYTLAVDRGISLDIDAMDNEETLGMAFGTLQSEFIRTQEVPEVDAYRFAKLAGTTGINAATPADITVGTTDCPALIDVAEEVLGDDEVPEDDRLLYVSEKFYAGIKAKTTRILANENNVQREIEVFNGMEVIRVPKGRFNTAITLNNGATNFGFTVGGYPINFMIIAPSAVFSVLKHREPRIFEPAVNQDKDAWKFDLRLYHDIFVYDNKVKGIYLHRAATAN